MKSLHENKEAESLSSISIIFDAHNLQLPTVNHDSTDSLMWQGTMPHKTYLFRSITAYKEKYLFKAYNNRVPETAFLAIIDMHILDNDCHFFGLDLYQFDRSDLKFSICSEIFAKS